MILIRSAGSRKAQNNHNRLVRVGLFFCNDCKNEVQLPILVGRNQSSCGCKGTIYRHQPAERTCLMCGKNFISRGPHNRRCVLCKRKLDVDGQAYYMPPVHKQNDHSIVAKCWES